MAGMGEPEESGDVELLSPLAGQAESLADLGEGLREVTDQAVVGDDDLM